MWEKCDKERGQWFETTSEKSPSSTLMEASKYHRNEVLTLPPHASLVAQHIYIDAIIKIHLQMMGTDTLSAHKDTGTDTQKEHRSILSSVVLFLWYKLEQPELI